MSASATPISPVRFAAALSNLPLSSLHTKAAEIRNSIAHLETSNAELKIYAVTGDTECSDALNENVEVINRMKERLGLLKKEVEGRGYMWNELESHDNEGNDDNNGTTLVTNGQEARSDERGDQTGFAATRSAERSGGRLDDEEMARLLQQRLNEHTDGVLL